MHKTDGTARARSAWVAAAVAVATLAASVGATDARSPEQPAPPVDGNGERTAAPAAPGTSGADEVAAALGTGGTVRVIVTTDLATEGEARLTTAEVASQRIAIDESLDGVAATIAGTASRVVSELDVVPSAVVEVDQAGLDALRADPSVQSISLDHEYGLLLDSSTSVIDSDRLNAAGVLGDSRPGTAGRFEVVVIDTGVARTHNALNGRVVSEACYSLASACPNGQPAQTGTGAARPCTFSTDCHHGTHVASTAAGGRFVNGHEGVARGAGVVAIRLGHQGSSGGWTFSTGDLHNALQRVLTLKNNGRRIASVNMSIGGGAFTSPCASFDPTGHTLTRQLRNAGVAVVAAAGNDSFLNAVGWPACLPYVYAVSATDDSDQIPLFTNSSAKTAWWAPGVEVTAAIPGGPNTKATFNGTSMATPHVAGAFALLRECPTNTTPAAVAADLNATGRTIVDEGRRRKRINVFDAARRNVGNDRFATPVAVPAAIVSNTLRSNVCATRESGEPGPGTPQNSVWFRWRPSRTGSAVISTADVGTKRTTFNTELTLFTGSRLDSLHRVAYNNDGGVGTRSRIVTRVTAGVTYRIRVDGVGAANGRYNLHVDPPGAG